MFTVLEQGDRTDEDYVRHVKDLSRILREQFGVALASKFIQDIKDSKDALTRKVVHGQLDDKYDLGQVVKAVLWATRVGRAALAQ